MTLTALVSTLAAVVDAGTQPAAAIENGLGRTPVMGWNSWNYYQCNIDENVVKKQADALVSTGMRDAGYKFVNLDDCWQTSRDSSGNIVADPERFPSGMKALGDYLHARGLKFGVYSDRGTQTCAERPGSQGYEYQDARSYASWGVDLLKYDNCHATLDQKTQYETMRDALDASGRDIILSICAWGFKSWAPKTGNMSRSTGDVMDDYTRNSQTEFTPVDEAIDKNNAFAMYAHPGFFNDPDMLQVGNYGNGDGGGLGMTDTEYQTHFSMWALMAAPLIAGNDLTSMNAATRKILLNPEVIAVDQDPLGVQGRKIRDIGDTEVWSKKLQGNGVRAVALWNRSTSAKSIRVDWRDIGLGTGSATVRDLHDRADRGTHTGGYSVSVPGHGVALLRVTGAETPDVVKITKTDTRTITDLQVRTEFLINDEWHDDHEDVGTFNDSTALNLNGNGATRDGNKWVGNLLKTASSSAGPAVVTINRTDPRFIYGARVHVTFKINGEQYTDFEELAPLSGTTNYQLNANGGTWNGSQYKGNFLRIQ
ncbi:glycoside hydrolase family 27 protein [Micromonospora sp. LH3U1]|uniref:glycoside hydrolase family 27 protein n=1 Tax=Micromonospora sp. LH3U1 TaxID=3018339 RepID=UPI002349B85F|nr:glycoside hydrolase family 27 protein [Micromonospora sp. LH3U1]WCN79569.1 glycoside hydrolase family 27 protein [Micromonospora sp. LH3U1]